MGRGNTLCHARHAQQLALVLVHPVLRHANDEGHAHHPGEPPQQQQLGLADSGALVGRSPGLQAQGRAARGKGSGAPLHSLGCGARACRFVGQHIPPAVGRGEAGGGRRLHCRAKLHGAAVLFPASHVAVHCLHRKSMDLSGHLLPRIHCWASHWIGVPGGQDQAGPSLFRLPHPWFQPTQPSDQGDD
eukprot:15478456-Alexandrium_andersonii.AAC.1